MRKVFSFRSVFEVDSQFNTGQLCDITRDFFRRIRLFDEIQRAAAKQLDNSTKRSNDRCNGTDEFHFFPRWFELFVWRLQSYQRGKPEKEGEKMMYNVVASAKKAEVRIGLLTVTKAHSAAH